jgi:hypothetical protein
MFWRKKNDTGSIVDKCAHSLFQALVEGLKVNGRVRAEDLITAAASIVGETCIATTGNYDPRKHNFVPGSRVFSDKVNELFSGDVADVTIDTIPAISIVGVLRDRLIAAGYDKSDFPSLKMIFEHFAANIGKPSDWGKVPLAVPDDNQPFILPLRIAYETRPLVDRIFQPISSTDDRLTASILALAESLIAVQQIIEKKTAVLLALQIVNGMSKTAPMTDEAMKALQKEGPAESPTTRTGAG